MATPALAQASTGTDPQFDHWLSLATGAVTAVARRRRLSADCAEQLKSDVWFKLASRFDAVVSRLEDPNASRAYFRSIAERALIDMRTRQWGKWRPSAAARRAGSAAVRLETLVNRDGHSLSDAKTRIDLQGLPGSAAGCAFQLQPRRRRVMISVDALERFADNAPTPEDSCLAQDQARTTRPVRRALQVALSTLDSEDARLIQLRFVDGMRVADIARTRGLEQKALYRRFERILASLRSQLAAAGVSRETASAIEAFAAMNTDEAEAA